MKKKGYDKIKTEPCFVSPIELDDKDNIIKNSSCSCHVKDIKGIMFGGHQSRFWMLRKHFNSMDKDTLEKLPFYSWECL